MAATTSGLPTTQEVSKDQLRRVLGLLAWMRYCNNTPSIRYGTFRRTESAAGYIKPDTRFWDENTTDGKGAVPLDADGNYSAEKNTPEIEDFVELMQVIRAFDSAKGPTFATNAGSLTSTDFDMYVHRPFQQVDLIIKENDVRKQLAKEMLEELTVFRQYGFERFDEEYNTLSEDSKKAYEMFSVLHAISLDRRDSGSIEEEGQFVRKGLRRLAKSAVAFFLFPVVWLSGVLFSTWGTAGRKYLAHAGLEQPDAPIKVDISLPLTLLNRFYSAVSLFLVTIPEVIVKSFFFPFRWALESGQWKADGLARRVVDGLESTLIGLLASPIILLNHLYASVNEVVRKTFTAPENDPGLKALKKILENNFGWSLDLTGYGWHFPDALIIWPYKLLRPFFDTIPRLISRTLPNTLRSIFPAMPGTTKEQRDKFFDGIERMLYSTLFVMNALFFSTLFAVGVFGFVGASVPGWIATLFGTQSGSITAAEFLSGFLNSVWGGLQHMGITVVEFVTRANAPVVQFFTELFSSAVNMFTSNPFAAEGVFGAQGVLAKFFSSLGLQEMAQIAHWSGTTWAIVGSIAAACVLGSLPMIYIAAQKNVQTWFKGKIDTVYNWGYKLFKGEDNKAAMIPDIKSDRKTVQVAVEKYQDEVYGPKNASKTPQFAPVPLHPAYVRSLSLTGLKDEMQQQVTQNQKGSSSGSPSKKNGGKSE